jgi:hypothetical protein
VELRSCWLAAVLVAAAVAVPVAGCTGGAPAGFSKGDHWTFPLLGPLEDGQLIAPATVHGKGPYLFALDLDAPISAIDEQIASDAQLKTGVGPMMVDESGAEARRGFAELIDLQLGTLSVGRLQVMLVPRDFYNTDGRRVDGVIGRDVLADSLAFGFDRDQGIAMLSTLATFAPPPGAIAINYESIAADPIVLSSVGRGGMTQEGTVDDASRAGVATRSTGPTIDVEPRTRRVASAEVAGVKFAMHLDLGSRTSQLRENLWAKAVLAPADVKIRTVDEVASVREVARGAIAAEVSLGRAKGSHVTMIPYVDKRFPVKLVDGALGLDFFLPYAVFTRADTRTFYLKPRGDVAATAAARIGRWGAAIPACPHPGCVAATLTPIDGGTRLDVVRDAEAAKHAFEIRIGVTPAAGKSASPLVVEMPASVDKISGGVPADYDGATVTVLDVAPFTRPCDGDAGCVYRFDAPAH